MYVAHAALPHLIKAADSDPRRVADLVNVSSVAGRRVGVGGGVYQATKHAVGVFSEALRQEVTERHVRVALMEPGAVDTELTHHMRPEVRDQLAQSGFPKLQSKDIADAITYMVTRPRPARDVERLPGLT